MSSYQKYSSTTFEDDDDDDLEIDIIEEEDDDINPYHKGCKTDADKDRVDQWMKRNFGTESFSKFDEVKGQDYEDKSIKYQENAGKYGFG